MTKRLVVLFSGNGSNFQALIDTCCAKFLNCQIVLGLSNNVEAYGLTRARNAKITTQVVDSNLYERDEYDRILISTIDYYTPDLIVLAGWNRILTSTFINHYGKKVINLHPSLPGGIIGLNAIRKAWTAYHTKQDREIKSGVMVHHVIEEVDKGAVISTMHVPMIDNETYESYEKRMHKAEHSILVNTVKSLTDEEDARDVEGTNILQRFPPVMSGKVRNIYDIGNNLYALEHTNRLSSFDRHVCDIRGKGEVLTATSAWWFKRIERDLGLRTHYVWSNRHLMVVRKCKLLPVEVVVRGFITGSTKTSLWTHYNAGVRTYCGITFPDGLVKNQRLEEPVITPTTKGIEDVPLSGEEVVTNNFMTQDQWDKVSSMAIRLFKYGQSVALMRGLLLVDTKYEFGVDEHGEVVLIDEVHTCDSSRYWFAETYDKCFADGKEPDKYDKDVVRDYIKSTVNDPYEHTEFDIPENVKETTTQVYTDFYLCLTNDSSELLSLKEDIENPTILNQETEGLIDHFYQEEKHTIFNRLGGVVILAGSQSDEKHVEKLKESLRKQKIVCYNHYASAHKNTEVVLSLLKSYNEMRGRIVYVTVAGRSNALSGVVACNTQYPTIACPPFSDKDDFMVNINSTLQMPSNVPVMTILEPMNVALSIKRMLTLSR